MAPHSRRRRRVDEESDSQDNLRARQDTPMSSDSSSSKRIRTNRYQSDSSAESPEPARQSDTSNHTRRVAAAARMVGGGHKPDQVFMPGAIVRVKVTNFVTYESAVFYPGPNLNMVIGPNGTGKSSLVCAICLGLGNPPKVLGRASQIGEFVKHGNDTAEIETELQGQPGDSNSVVRLRIIKDGDKRKWWIDGAESTHKAVQALTRGFGIQVDNLCQFLPQDRVSEFAGLSPIDLLHETQRAAAPEQMLAWHDELKRLRKDEKEFESAQRTDQEKLENLEQRQEGLRADVERLQERAQIQTNVRRMEQSKPFVEYRTAREAHQNSRKTKKEAQARLLELEMQSGPALQAVNAKQEYQRAIGIVVKERKRALNLAEGDADELITAIEEVEAERKVHEQSQIGERESDKKRRLDVQNKENAIRGLKVKLDNGAPEFDANDWNTRIRATEHNVREIEDQMREAGVTEQDLMTVGKEHKDKKEALQKALQDLETNAGQMMKKLKNISNDTARAWEWIQQHPEEFDMEVLGPPLITCSVSDRRYTDAIESLLKKNDFLTITAQTQADFKKLGRVLFDELHLADVSTRVVTSNTRRPSPMSRDEIARLGFDGWAIDFMEGPEPLLAALTTSAYFSETGISLKDVTEQQFGLIQEAGIKTWVNGRISYQVNQRKEYGPGAKSTVTRTINSARYWTDQGVDMGEKVELQNRLAQVTEEFDRVKAQVMEIRAQKVPWKTERESLKTDLDKLKESKAALQRLYAAYAALPDKISREEENLEQLMQRGREVQDRISQLISKQEDLVLRKAMLALQLKDKVSAMRDRHEELLEAEIRFLEASSDVEALERRNVRVKERLVEEKNLVAQITREAAAATEKARRALDVCKEIIDKEPEHAEYFRTLPVDVTEEGLQHDIDAENSKLEYIHDGNQGALEEFEKRGNTIERLAAKMEDTKRRLSSVSEKIQAVRQMWEPELDKLITEISDAFAYNFSQIGCAGEVGVHKDDDFDLWSIEIKVKFRENETLQLLDQHRQSGGERSVSTIFYLMSLQSLARAPFRVVDEINQGMDPRNERMVHERMVEIACKEHTSQYFLITPKLLTDLRYDPRMKVLLINSGEYMPEDHQLLGIKKAIAIRRGIMAA